LLDSRQAGHGRFNGCREKLFDVFGGETRRLCIDVDLVRGDVGERIHRYREKGADAEESKQRESQQNQ